MSGDGINLASRPPPRNGAAGKRYGTRKHKIGARFVSLRYIIASKLVCASSYMQYKAMALIANA